MSTPEATETTLRHAVIDRLIAASLADSTPAREAEMKSWRTIGAGSGVTQTKVLKQV